MIEVIIFYIGIYLTDVILIITQKYILPIKLINIFYRYYNQKNN